MYFRNLLIAFKALTEYEDFREFLLDIDRIFNAITGGIPYATISARVGYFAANKPNLFWLALQKIIDETFRPWDGSGHCYEAYRWEQKLFNNEYRRGSDIALVALSLVTSLGCLILLIPIYIYAAIKKKK